MSGLAPRVCATLAALEEGEGLGPEAKGLAKLVHYHQLARRMEDYVGKAGICLVAAALDPKHGHLRFVSEELRDATWALVERWASELPPPWPSAAAAAADAEGGEVIPAFAPNEDMIKSAVKRLRDFHEGIERPKGARKGMVEQYWGSAVLKANSPHTPLVQVARFVFTMPVGSAASERSFSGAGFVVNKRRGRLSPAKVEKLGVVREFIQSFNGD